MTRSHGLSTAAACALFISAACGDGGGGTHASSSDEATLTPGQTAFARKLGGAGYEWGAGMATCADGSVIAASMIGSEPTHQQFGVTRISAAGATVWARTFDIRGGEGGVVGVACSPLGNVFLGVQVMSGSLDVGAGSIFGPAVVKLSPAGALTWQHAFDGSLLLTSLSVDGNGSVLAGLVDLSGASPWRAAKITWDDRVAWAVEGSVPDGTSHLAVAWDPSGNAIVADDQHVRKYTGDGEPVWIVALAGAGVTVTGVGTTAIGTVVVTGAYGDASGGTMSAGDKTLTWTPVQSAFPAFAAAVEGVDGYVRWLSNRASTGPMAVDPVGCIAFIDTDGPLMTGPDCRSDLVRWDLTGKELWRRPLVTCVGVYNPGWGAQGRGVAIGPNSGIWAQGDAFSAFDPGTGTTFTPQASDWFLLRVAP